MMEKVYLYAVGLVLVLGLVLPFDANAGHNTPGTGNCAAWRTNANGDMECATGGSSNNNQQNNHNQGGWPGGGQSDESVSVPTGQGHWS